MKINSIGIVLLCVILAIGVISMFKWLLPKQDNANRLIVGTCSGFPPYEILNEKNELVGFDIDIARIIAKKMEKDLEIKDMSFDSLIISLQQGSIDLAIAGISITPSRQQKIELIHYVGNPLTKLPLVFWNEIPVGIKSIHDLPLYTNKTVCVQAGTIQEEIISSFKGLDIKHLENIPGLIMDIKYGKSIAAVLEPKVAYELRLKNPELKMLDIPLKREQRDGGSGIGVRKDNFTLIKRVQEIFNELKSNGAINQLESQWFGGSNDT